MSFMEEKKEWHKHKEGHHKKSTKNISLYTIFVGLTLLLGIILIVNIFLTFNLSNEFKKSSELARESLKPAKIELTLIKNSKCSDCFDTSTIVSHIKNSKVNITKETIFEFDSKEGKETISRYKIEKVPAVVVTGEIGKLSIQGLEKKENALLLAKLEPPYTDAATGKIEGRVTLYHLKDTECEKCNDLTPLISQIKGAGIRIYEQKNITPSSDEGKELIKKYNLGFAPAIILSKDAAVYDIMQKAWTQIGSKESDGSYVLRLVNPPFINLTTGKLRGLVGITYLTDKSCAECYDVSLHKEILANPQTFAMKLDKEETIDISDAKGKEMIARYNITLVPTAILSNEAGVYPSSQVLKQFYSVDKDGSYIFRRLQVLGTYRDLSTNNVVKAPQRSQAQ